jgi:hypothetical protein
MIKLTPKPKLLCNLLAKFLFFVSMNFFVSIKAFFMGYPTIKFFMQISNASLAIE